MQRQHNSPRRNAGHAESSNVDEGRHPADGRLQGLPRDADVGTIAKILGRYAFAVRYHGLHVIYDVYGKPTGEAFIQMDSESSALWASLHCHGRYMAEKKPHYIEAFQCSLDDVLGRSTAILALSPFDVDAPVATPYVAFHPDLPLVPLLSPVELAALPSCDLPGYAPMPVIATFSPEPPALFTYWDPLLCLADGGGGDGAFHVFPGDA